MNEKKGWRLKPVNLQIKNFIVIEHKMEKAMSTGFITFLNKVTMARVF